MYTFPIVKDNLLPPPPDAIKLNSNLKMWIIEDVEIWAENYQSAIEIYNLTKN